MNVETVQMDQRTAWSHYKNYRKAVRKHRQERLDAARAAVLAAGRDLRSARSKKSLIECEDEALMLSYREMAKGERILNLAQVFRETGIDKNEKSHLPVLAIARADWPHVWFQHDSPRVVFSKGSWAHWGYNRNKYECGGIHFPQEIFPGELTNAAWRRANGLPEARNQRALVPAIPVMLRPSGDLSDYYILWEAVWEHRAPVDPLLLRHVTGTIYTVLAQWDLTPVEKMVLEGRVAS